MYNNFDLEDELFDFEDDFEEIYKVDKKAMKIAKKDIEVEMIPDSEEEE